MGYRVYKYRNKVIFKDKESKKWVVINVIEEYKTLDEAKNAIDKIAGGYSGKNIPSRWLKDKKLKKLYMEYMGIKNV